MYCMAENFSPGCKLHEKELSVTTCMLQFLLEICILLINIHDDCIPIQRTNSSSLTYNYVSHYY